MTTPPASAAPTGMKPWLRIVFGLSLAVNLLVVGLMVGAFLRFGLPGGDRPPPPTGISVFRALPSEDRKALRDHLRETLPPPADRRSEVNALVRALTADPFDPEALEAVMTAQAAPRIAFQEAMEQAWLQRVVTMDDAERADYADRLVRMAEHGKDHGPRDGKHDGKRDD